MVALEILTKKRSKKIFDLKDQILRSVSSNQMNERITEDIVRSHFKLDNLYDKIKIEEQKSSISQIQELLKNASKRKGVHHSQ